MSKRSAARILLAGLAALSLASAAHARPGHGGHFSGSHHFSGGPRHFDGGHFHSRIFIGGAFFAPFYYPPPYYDPYYYYAPPVEYVEPSPAPPQQYWYYCPSAGAYYPYVRDCPGGWQKVLPQ
jgi:hypothetical protein